MAPPPEGTVTTNITAATFEERRYGGIVYDKWPFRLDIYVEYQDWILVAVSLLVLMIWCIPCLCGRMRNSFSQAFTKLIYSRLHYYFCVVTYVNLALLMFTIGILPDWTVDEYIEYSVDCIGWVLEHMVKLIQSFAILAVICIAFSKRERLAQVAGMGHVTVFRINWRQLFGFRTRRRPVELFIWKVEGLQSSTSKVMKANDVYIECHMATNEPMRTRVHNNAGTSCIIKDSFQLNVEPEDTDAQMTLLVKDQSLVTSSELARLTLTVREICGIEDQTGKRRTTFQYSDDSFVCLELAPDGKIWIAVAPVEDVDDEHAPLMGHDDLLCC